MNERGNLKCSIQTGPLGPYLNDVYTFSEILDPLPRPCLHSGQITSTKITQPPLLRLHLSNPLPPPSVDVI